MLKAIIVDDEEDGRTVMEVLLRDHFKDISIEAICENGKDGVKAIIELHPDIVFLDIDMPGMNGFDVLDCVKSLPVKVIFVTAHNEHAIRAFKYSAVDYILKPVSIDDLREAISKAQNIQFHQMGLVSRYEMLLNQLNQKDQVPEVIALPLADGLQVVNVHQIMYCKADRNYTHVHIHPAEKVLVSRPLKEFENMLIPHGFFRIHHSALINMKYVSKYVRSDGGYVLMKDNSSIEIARQRKDAFLKLIQKV
jgi:two-component system, LytTR family, response regulator